jgi:sarcosine/dimethylglycine N-methyltransferase
MGATRSLTLSIAGVAHPTFRFHGRDSSISFLLTAQATRAKLEAAGFDIIAFEDQTARALARAEERMKPASAPLALGLHIVLGQDAPTMLKNMLRNYQEGRIGLVQGIVSPRN